MQQIKAYRLRREYAQYVIRGALESTGVPAGSFGPQIAKALEWMYTNGALVAVEHGSSLDQHLANAVAQAQQVRPAAAPPIQPAQQQQVPIVQAPPQAVPVQAPVMGEPESMTSPPPAGDATLLG